MLTILVRFADDFVIGFELEDDAKRVMGVLASRFERYGLRLHPDKTRLVPFKRPAGEQSDGRCRPSLTGADAIGIGRLRSNRLRSRGNSLVTTITSE